MVIRLTAVMLPSAVNFPLCLDFFLYLFWTLDSLNTSPPVGLQTQHKKTGYFILNDSTFFLSTQTFFSVTEEKARS